MHVQSIRMEPHCHARTSIVNIDVHDVDLTALNGNMLHSVYLHADTLTCSQENAPPLLLLALLVDKLTISSRVIRVPLP